MVINIMKKFVFLFFILVGCVGCIEKLLIAKGYHLFFEQEHIIINPEKSVYKVGDTININIVFPKRLMAENGSVEELEPKKKEYLAQLYEPKSYKDSVDFFVKGGKIFENDYIKTLDVEYSGTHFSLKDKIQLVFKKEGEYSLKELVIFYTSVNYYQTVEPNKEKFNKTFKVEP